MNEKGKFRYDTNAGFAHNWGLTNITEQKMGTVTGVRLAHKMVYRLESHRLLSPFFCGMSEQDRKNWGQFHRVVCLKTAGPNVVSGNAVSVDLLIIRGRNSPHFFYAHLRTVFSFKNLDA